MASAGCFLERRPLAASNLSRPSPSKRRTISTAMLPPPCQFSLSIEYVQWNGQLSVISLYPRVSPFSFWNFVQHLWTNETGKSIRFLRVCYWIMIIAKALRSELLIYSSIKYFSFENILFQFFYNYFILFHFFVVTI